MDNAFKKSLAVFDYEDISLRPLAAEDLPYTLAWRNAYKEWFNTSDTILLADHLNWFAHYQQKTNDFVFIVQDQQANRVGQAAVYNIDWEKKNGEFGRFLVNPDFAGKSYMKKSARAMVALCGEQLQLSSLYLQVKPHNERAIHIYQSIGFTLADKRAGENLLMHFKPF